MNEIEEEAKNLKEKLKAVKNKAKFARDYGINGGGPMIYQHENGLKPISLEAGKAYAKGFNCTLGEISRRLAKLVDVDYAPDFSKHKNTEPVEITGRVPLISWVAAGKWCNVDNPYEVGDAEDWVVCPVKHSSKTYALRVKGDSMHNPGGNESFSDGDLIFVDPERGYSHRSYVVVHIDNENQATFKRLLIDGDRKMLEALNPSWPDRIFEIKKDATICGVVIAKVVSLIRQ